jgi:DNA-directed RNA polymerase specialized sigma24 family protein
MSDPAVSAQAGPTEVIVRNAAVPFEDFFRGQTQSLYAHLCPITGNRAEAEELAQDAFLKVWERWDRVADMEEPIGYLYPR